MTIDAAKTNWAGAGDGFDRWRRGCDLPDDHLNSAIESAEKRPYPVEEAITKRHEEIISIIYRLAQRVPDGVFALPQTDLARRYKIEVETVKWLVRSANTLILLYDQGEHGRSSRYG